MLERPKGGETCILVQIKYREPQQTNDFEEFAELAVSAGAVILHKITCPRKELDPSLLIGSGKADEISELVKELKAELVIFNFTLSPIQERNLEKKIKARVLDRTGLILDIFASRARTFEGKLQVELAQLTHHSTRLVRGWTHLERQKGGIGLRGPGETQLESDRRIIKDKITTIKQRLQKVRQQRQQGRQQRRKAELPSVALVGYTNAGKSTLFNKLTKSEVYAEDKLFATLDPTLRAININRIGKVILADTVGFISNLPHELIDSFRATLEEVTDSDLLLHVIDISDCMWEQRKRDVEVVLAEIKALQVPMLEVYNKIDLSSASNPGAIEDHDATIRRVRVSAKNNLGLDELTAAIANRLSGDIVKGVLKLEPKQAQIRAQLYNLGAVDGEEITASGQMLLSVTLPKPKWERFCQKYSDLKLTT